MALHSHPIDTITDFEISDDVIDLSRIVMDSSCYPRGNAVSEYLEFVQIGANTKVNMDVLGDGGNQFKTLATLNNVDAQTLSDKNFVV